MELIDHNSHGLAISCAKFQGFMRVSDDDLKRLDPPASSSSVKAPSQNGNGSSTKQPKGLMDIAQTGDNSPSTFEVEDTDDEFDNPLKGAQNGGALDLEVGDET